MRLPIGTSWRGWVLALATVATLNPGAALAQKAATTAKPATTVNPDIQTLMQLIGADKLGEQMAGFMSSNAAEMIARSNPGISSKALAAAQDEMHKVFVEHMPALLNKIGPIYAKHFTAEEIKGLISFYRTPLGTKLIKETPLIFGESTQVGREWGESLGPELGKRVEARLKKEGAIPPGK